MGKIDPNRAGLVVGALLASWHLLWSVLVALGVAHPLIDFLFWIHFIEPVYVIEPFAFVRAAILIVSPPQSDMSSGSYLPCYGIEFIASRG